MHHMPDWRRRWSAGSHAVAPRVLVVARKCSKNAKSGEIGAIWMKSDPIVYQRDQISTKNSQNNDITRN
jgi:hypothetical protein